MVCQPDYGYEVRAGQGGSWVDVGGFANVCSSASFGYKFSGLSPSTTYVLSVRAYHLVNGTKVYSPEASLTTSTLEASTPLAADSERASDEYYNADHHVVADHHDRPGHNNDNHRHGAGHNNHNHGHVADHDHDHVAAHDHDNDVGAND